MTTITNRLTTRCLSASAAVLCCTAAARAAAAGPSGAITLTGENTVILDRSVYAGRWLQFYLIRGVAKHPDAMAYAPDARTDRAAAPVFPLFGNPDAIPPGKHILVVAQVGRAGDYLDGEEKARLARKQGSLLVKRKGDNVVIVHTGGPWDLAAIRVFLDKCAGVRLYAPTGPTPSEDELWLAMPASDGIAIDADLELFMQPYFAKTTFSSGGHERNKEWLRMNSIVSEGLDLRASHTIISYFPPEKYYDEHPQLYPMHKNGKRPRPIGDAWNPCLADPELAAKIAMREVRGMQENNKRGYLSFGVMDCHYDCRCGVCSASLAEHEGNAANLWYAFLNRVARQCREEFPGLYLTSYAYANIGIPGGMTIEPNIVVDNVIKSYRFNDPEFWEAERNGILAFADLGASWVTHDWNFQGVTPRIYSRQLARFLQWGAQNGMLGIYTEWSGQEYWYLAGAHYWVLRQLLSDPYQDPDLLWKQYCRDMYGAGWEPMYRFYDLFQQKHVVADAYCVLQDWPRQESIAFTEDDLALQRGWLESAVAATRDDPLIQRRLAAVMRRFRAHELLARAVGVPGRAHHEYAVLRKQTGINRAALAFYVNDDGSRLLEFDRYYDTERTVAPDSNAEDRVSGIRFSYRNNYARALGTIIQAVKARAMEGIDMASADLDAVQRVVRKAGAIYRQNLPQEYDEARAAEVQELMQKILWIPRASVLPEFDGELADPVWEQAARLTGWTQADLLLPTAEGNETDGRIMRVGDHLVVGLVCRQPNGIWAETPADVHTGTRIWREAGCEFFFGPPAETEQDQEYIQYIVNALGAFRGFRKAQDNREGVRCAVKEAEDGKSYTIEAAIPLKVEGLYDYSMGRVFTFNVMRNPFYDDTFNPTERIGWAPIFFTAQKPESRGLVVLE